MNLKIFKKKCIKDKLNIRNTVKTLIFNKYYFNGIGVVAVMNS